MLQDVARQCYLAYGGIRRNPFGVYTNDQQKQILDHFLYCPDEEAIDFIEWCFQSQAYQSYQEGVDIINGVLRQEGIGYEFSPFVVSNNSAQFPEATKKTNELIHSQVVMPTLQLLSDPRFKVANDEMLKAHAHYRNGDFAAVINSCGQCFESILKTICTKKKWTFDAEKDALAALVEICSAKGLFPAFYAEIFKNSGTIRNKLGSHGGGPNPPHGVATAEQAEHMLHLTSAHILFLARIADFR